LKSQFKNWVQDDEDDDNLANISIQLQGNSPKCQPGMQAVYQTCLYGTDYNQDKNNVLNLVQSQDTYTVIGDAIELLLGGIPKIDALLQQAFHKFDASEEISDEDIPFLFIFVILCLCWKEPNVVSHVKQKFTKKSVDTYKYLMTLLQPLCMYKPLQENEKVSLIVLTWLVCS
jgi:hypothetical protein